MICHYCKNNVTPIEQPKGEVCPKCWQPFVENTVADFFNWFKK